MEMQREVPRSVEEIEDAESSHAFAQFVSGLRTMSVDIDAMVENFAWCAGQIAGAGDAPARIRGMIDFAIGYRKFGLENAVRSITENSGVRVNLGVPNTREVEKPGLIVGFTDAHLGTHDEPLFDGIAVVEDSRGRGVFVAVTIAVDGETVINGEEDQLDIPETKEYMKELSGEVNRLNLGKKK